MHHSFYSLKSLTNVFIDIAKGKNDFYNKLEKVVAELVKKGYVMNDSGKLTVNVPVFTNNEFESFIIVESVEENANSIM